MPDLAAVVIGRNEGARLAACLDSLAAAGLTRVIYVDSGSTDGSPALAAARGATVVDLDMAQPFTAARARNAGLAALTDSPPRYAQLIDGDCTLAPGWIDIATAFISGHPNCAVVAGRLHERHPEASAYNRLCDREWDVPIGEATSCGGIAFCRFDPIVTLGGFDPALIAGEEPDLCLRLRRAGWRIWRIEAEMALHDAAMTRFAQFWTRARRAGHAYAEGAARYGAAPERHFVRETRRALIWGLGLPAATLLATLLAGPIGLALLAAYPLQVARLARRDGLSRPAWEVALLLTLAKFAETQGILGYHLRRRPARLIEYK